MAEISRSPYIFEMRKQIHVALKPALQCAFKKITLNNLHKVRFILPVPLHTLRTRVAIQDEMQGYKFVSLRIQYAAYCMKGFLYKLQHGKHGNVGKHGKL